MRRQLIRLLRRLRKTNRVVTVLLYAVFGTLTFFVSLSLSLPIDKIKDRIERELSQDQGPPISATGGFGIGTGMDVAIGELDLHVLRPGVSATDVRLKPRKVPGSDAAAAKNLRPIVIDRLDARVKPLDAAFGTKSGSLSVEAFGGELTAEGSQGDDGVQVVANLHDVTLLRLSALSGLLPLPMLGTLALSLHFKAPNQKPATPARAAAAPLLNPPPPRLDVAKAVGDLEIKLGQATIGDGKAKLVVPGDAFLSQGITFPKLRLGDVIGKVTIERGRANIVDVHAKSPDVELWVDGYLELRDPIQLSDARLYVRFKPSPQLTAREPTMELVVNSQSQGKRADGAIGFAITGSLANPKAKAAKDPPDGVVLRAGTLGQVSPAARPSFSPGTPPAPSPSPPPMMPSQAAPQPQAIPSPPPPSSDTVVVPPPPQNPPPIQQAIPSPPPPPNPLASAGPPPGTLHVPPPNQPTPSEAAAPSQQPHSPSPESAPKPEASPVPAPQ